MSERMNGTREREREEKKQAFYDLYKLDELLMTNNIEAVRELLATNWTLIYNYHIKTFTRDIHYRAIVSNTDYTDMTKLLLSHGAPVNTRDWTSFTTLHHVCSKGKVKLCELFLTNGARYDVKWKLGLWKYKTPLCFATNVDVVKVLIR